MWGAAVPPWQVIATLIVLGVGMGLTQSPVATAVTLAVKREELGVALGIFNMVRFIGASLGTTAFGLILGQATGKLDLAPYRHDYAMLIGVAAAAVLLIVLTPGSRPVREDELTLGTAARP
jgi:MFS family permease